MNSNKQREFEKQLLELQDRFLAKENIGETDEKIAADTVELILMGERRRRDVADGTPEAAAVDSETIAKMKTWDSNYPSMAPLEKVFRRFVSGQGALAVTYLKQAITDKAKAISDEQRCYAQKPRAKCPLNILIEKFVKKQPDITESKLKSKLQDCVGGAIITDMEENEIVLTESGKVINTSALKDRLSRIKKRIRLAKAG